MTNRTALGLIVVALGLILAIVNFKLFPRVEVAKNTQTVNHTYEAPKPAPNNYGPPLAPGCKKACGHGGGGGVIVIGG